MRCAGLGGLGMTSSIVAIVLASMLCSTASAAVLFSESWESASLGEGASLSLPDGLLPLWQEEPFAQNAVVSRPGSAAEGPEWNATEPFAPPADVNHMLVLADGGAVDNGVFAVLPVQIQGNTTYSFTAAVGFRNDTSDAGEWSIQLWADTNGNGVLDRSSGDAFLIQTCPPVTPCPGVNPAQGEWVNNTIVFKSDDHPAVIGSSIILFVNNFAVPNVSSSPVFFDNLRLEAVPTVPALGWPAILTLSLALLMLGILLRPVAA